MQIKLKKLSYQGFRGQSRNIPFSPQKTEIFARNGEGKSTVLNAFLFLLSGFDAEDRSNFNLFNNKEVYGPENIGYVEVIGNFEVDGEPMKFTRRVNQKWVMGENGKYSRSNDTYEYLIDDLTVSATQYKTTVSEMFGDGDFLKYMLNIHYYRQQTDWKELRKAFAQIAGEVTLADMKGDYKIIADSLSRQDAETLRKTYNNRLRDLNKAKDRKDAEIKAYKDSLPKLSDIEFAESEVEKLKDERTKIEERQKALVGQNDEYISKRKAEEDVISAKRVEYMNAKMEHDRIEQAKIDEAVAEYRAAKQYNAGVVSKRSLLRREIDNYKSIIQSLSNQLEDLRTENKRINSRVFNNVCSECGQPYIGEKLEDKIRAFNLKKQIDREENIVLGKKKKEELEELEKTLKEKEEELANSKLTDLQEYDQKIREVTAARTEYDGSALLEEINTLEATKTSIPEIPESLHLQKRVGEINAQIEKILSTSPKRSELERVEGKILLLTKELNEINRDIVSNMQLKNAVESYQREYAEIVKINVNKYFDKVSVVMTQYNKSGILEDCCKLMLDGVTDSNNYASKVLIGVELAKAFQKYFGLELPLFIDNAESLDEVNVPSHSQIVMLVRSDCPFTVISDSE